MSVGDGPHGLQVGDFNGDGLPEFVTVNLRGNSFTVALGDGQGRFPSIQGFLVGASDTCSVAVGDFNLDGKPDVATADAANNTISVFLNTVEPPTPVYQLSSGTPGGGLVVPDPLLASYEEGTMVMVSAVPANGWTFMGWLGDMQVTATTVNLVIQNDTCLEGIFGTTVRSVASGAGEVALWPDRAPYPFGSQVQVQAIPEDSWYFKR